MAKEERRVSPAKLGQPHDGLVKYAFSKREHAEGLLKAILDPTVVALCDWTTLALVKDSFIDRELRARHADLLFSVRMGSQTAYFYVLVEHQCQFAASWGHPAEIFAGSWGHPVAA